MSEDRRCPICGEALNAWAEMDSDTGKSFSAQCPYCTTYIIPEGMIDKVKAVQGDAKWLLSGTVNAKFTDTKQPVLVDQALVDGVLAQI